MSRTQFILFLVAILAIGGGSLWYLVETREASLERSPDSIVGPDALNEGTAIYTNGTYGFSLTYPQSAEVEYGFAPSYHLGSAWRATAPVQDSGVPVVAIIPYTVTQEAAYPRSFAALVRIGASTDAADVAACEEPVRDQAEVQLPDVEIQGRTWSAFSFENAGMMQYASGVSYRTVHEGACIALEKLRTGSSYREEPSPEDIPDSELDAAYGALSSIVASFRFAR